MKLYKKKYQPAGPIENKNINQDIIKTPNQEYLDKWNRPSSDTLPYFNEYLVPTFYPADLDNKDRVRSAVEDNPEQYPSTKGFTRNPNGTITRDPKEEERIADHKAASKKAYDNMSISQRIDETIKYLQNRELYDSYYNGNYGGPQPYYPIPDNKYGGKAYLRKHIYNKR